MKVLSQGLLDLKKKKKTVSERTFNYYNIRSKNQAQKKAPLIITIFSDISVEFSYLAFLASRNSIAANRFLIVPKYVFCLFSTCILGNLQIPVAPG